MENLPENCPVILACNHPNAFLDSIVMTTCARRSLHYTARGDFFKSKVASFLLRYIQILPVFRGEEGKEHLYKNEETFSYCIEVLKKNGAVSIFSEGLSENEYDLRPLRKGTARLASEAWGNPDIGDKLKVVPVAIQYSSWLKSCPVVYVEFLKNIERKSFADIDESGLFNKKFNEELKDILMEKCIVVDKSGDVFLQNKLIRYVLKNFNNGVSIAKKVQDKYLSPGNESFKKNYNVLSEFLTAGNINYWKESETGIINFLFSALVYIVACVTNVIPYYVSKLIAWKSAKDNAFKDSLLYCTLMIIYPMYLISLFCVIKSYLNISAGIIIVLLTLVSAFRYERSRRNIRCFLKKDKLRIVHEMLSRLFETSNG